MRKGKLALEVLRVLGQTALSTAEVIDAVLTSPYGASYGTLQRNLRQAQRKRQDHAEAQKRQRIFYDLLHRLKRDGLIVQQPRRGLRNLWWLTAGGKEELNDLQHYFAKTSPRRYEAGDGTAMVIIAFDIPERYKRKRQWLRAALKHLGFSMLQRSVWIGRRVLPPTFIEDLRGFDLLAYVEILAVTKTGSLKDVARQAR